LLQNIDNQEPTKPNALTYPLKLEVVMSKSWHGVKYAEAPVSADNLAMRPALWIHELPASRVHGTTGSAALDREISAGGVTKRI
jgi:hypothetical protein